MRGLETRQDSSAQLLAPSSTGCEATAGSWVRAAALGDAGGLYILAFRDPDNIQLELTAAYG